MFSFTVMDSSPFIGYDSEVKWRYLVSFNRSHFKSLMEADVMLLLLSIIAALLNALAFTNGLMRAKICLMFAKMYELKRVVVPGPALPCTLYVLSSFIIVFFCCWFFMRIFFSRAVYNVRNRWTKIVVFFIPLIAVANMMMLLHGNQVFCDSFDVHHFCSSELMHNIDFKTFTPKYLDAYSYFDVSRVSTVSSVLVCIFWIAAFYYHHKKHHNKLLLP